MGTGLSQSYANRKVKMMELAKFHENGNDTTVIVKVLSNEGGLREGDIYTEEGRIIVVELCPGYWIRKSE